MSVRNIPVTECATYFGVSIIGRAADQQKNAGSQLYTSTNILLAQNHELHKCSTSVKNVSIYCYSNVYSIVNFLSVKQKLRAAERYMTKSVHTDWRRYADLEGPNIRSRTHYTSFQVDSLEVFTGDIKTNF